METDKTPPKNVQKGKPKSSLNALARYSGMAFQIAGAVILGWIIGNWLDKQFEVPKHLFTALFMILGVFLGLYSVVRDLLKR